MGSFSFSIEYIIAWPFLVMSYVFSSFIVLLRILYLSLSEGEKATVFM